MARTTHEPLQAWDEGLAARHEPAWPGLAWSWWATAGATLDFAFFVSCHCLSGHLSSGRRNGEVFHSDGSVSERKMKNGFCFKSSCFGWTHAAGMWSLGTLYVLVMGLH